MVPRAGAGGPAISNSPHWAHLGNNIDYRDDRFVYGALKQAITAVNQGSGADSPVGLHV